MSQNCLVKNVSNFDEEMIKMTTISEWRLI